MTRTSKSEKENSLLMRTVMLGSLLLAVLFVGITFLEKPLQRLLGQYGDEAAVGLMLLALWLTVSSSIRSVFQLRKSMPWTKLIIAGVTTAFVGTVLYVGFLLFYPALSRNTDIAGMSGASITLTVLFTGAGVVVSMVSLIRLKVQNSRLSGLIEFILLVLFALAFVYYAGR